MEVILKIIILAADYARDFLKSGPETIIRCKGMLELAHLSGPIILAAGKHPNHPTARPLRKCMQDTLQELRIENRVQLTTDDPWGTYDELCSALYYVREDEELHIISSRSHIGRIKLILKSLGKTENVHYHPVPYWNTKRVLREIVLYVCALFGKFRNPKRKEENFAQLREKIS